MQKIEINIPSLPFEAYKIANVVTTHKAIRFFNYLNIRNTVSLILIIVISFITFKYFNSLFYYFLIFIFISLFIIDYIFNIFAINKILKYNYKNNKLLQNGFTLTLDDRCFYIKTSTSFERYELSLLQDSFLWNNSFHIIFYNGGNILWIPEEIITNHKDAKTIRNLLKLLPNQNRYKN